MIEGLGNSLRAFWQRYSGRVTPVSKVDNEGMNTEEQRERARFSARKGAEAQTHYLYGADGQQKPVEPPEGHNLDEIG
ncbi:MAG: hypothetical protein KJ017_09430 [Alphaproteobacteria bacterium]|nr:hypothetical protein [Alphaproteobacteria bacterium]